MLFGMTRGEIGLVVFVFLLVYAAVLLPRLGERLGVSLATRRKRSGRDGLVKPP